MLRSLFYKDDEWERALAMLSASPLESGHALFVGVAENSKLDVQEVLKGLRQVGCPFFGGVFPGLIWGGRRYEQGVIISRLPVVAEPVIIEGLGAAPELPLDMIREHRLVSPLSAFLLVDGLSAGTAGLIQRLREMLDGHRTTFVGAGAGRLTMEQEPCVFNNRGIYADAAVLALVPRASLLGIRHGWEILQAPHIATRTKGNVLIELDGRDAFEVYRDVVERDASRTFDGQDFYSLSMKYPLGIQTDEHEYIVRDPLKRDDEGHLVCCGDIPEGSTLCVMKGRPEKLIEAADVAARGCLSRAFSASVSHAFIIDCISRMLFLRDLFERELDVINRQLTIAVNGPEPLGVLSLGEIASYSDGVPQLFNKTTVLAMVLE